MSLPARAAPPQVDRRAGADLVTCVAHLCSAHARYQRRFQNLFTTASLASVCGEWWRRQCVRLPEIVTRRTGFGDLSSVHCEALLSLCPRRRWRGAASVRWRVGVAGARPTWVPSERIALAGGRPLRALRPTSDMWKCGRVARVVASRAAALTGASTCAKQC